MSGAQIADCATITLHHGLAVVGGTLVNDEDLVFRLA